MSPLPRSRVAGSAPFARTGIDYLGTLYVKCSDGVNKVWICLLTCLVTRAIHLELMSNMSSEECLMGFRRIIAFRGTPIKIISDNAQHFKLAS